MRANTNIQRVYIRIYADLALGNIN